MSLWWGSSTTKFDEDVDKATSEMLPTGAENLELSLEISDAIRSKSIPAKDAMRSIKRRVNHKNPNVQLLALSLTDTAVKNGGDHFLTEIASREFLDNLVSIIKTPTCNLDVKQKILRLIQNWAMAFESKPTLHYAGELYKSLQKDGFVFPPKDLTATSAAMIDSMAPPEWIDSDVCLRCRTPFSFTNRKHHCRSCGLVFDQQCSSKVLPLPHLGIDQPVRVCDPCFVKVGPKVKTNGDSKEPHPHRSSSKHAHSHSHPSPSSQSQSNRHARSKSAREQADDDLQRAIQLSLEEAGMTHGPRRTDYVPQPESPRYEVSEPPLVESSAGGVEEDDPDLKAAIEASLREANAPRASAPVGLEDPGQQQGYAVQSPAHYQPSYPQFQPLPNYDLNDRESDAIMTFNQTVETAQTRGAPDYMRHRQVTELYQQTDDLTPRLARSLDDTDRRGQLLSEMNQKLSQAARLYDQLLTAQGSSPHLQQQQQQPAQPYAFYTPPPLPNYAIPHSQPQPQPQPQEAYQTYAPPQPSYAPQSNPTPVPAPISHSPEPMSAASYAPQSYATSPATASVPVPVQSPPPQTQTQYYASPPPAQHALPPSQPQYQSYTPQPYPPQQQQQQPQQYSAPPQQQQQQSYLPAFPAVPSAPLPAAPQPQAQPEPKEAMLISFD